MQKKLFFRDKARGYPKWGLPKPPLVGESRGGEPPLVALCLLSAE